MRFDESKVYTVMNAKQVKVGSKVFVGNCVEELKRNVKCAVQVKLITKVDDGNSLWPFVCSDKTCYNLVYLLEAGETVDYKPFTINFDLCLKIVREKSKRKIGRYVVIGQNDKGVVLAYPRENKLVSYSELLENYEFLDSSVCGFQSLVDEM